MWWSVVLSDGRTDVPVLVVEVCLPVLEPGTPLRYSDGYLHIDTYSKYQVIHGMLSKVSMGQNVMYPVARFSIKFYLSPYMSDVRCLMG
jgi:hypothetical protein